MLRTQVQSSHLYGLPLIRRAAFGQVPAFVLFPESWIVTVAEIRAAQTNAGRPFSGLLKLTLQEEV